MGELGFLLSVAAGWTDSGGAVEEAQETRGETQAAAFRREEHGVVQAPRDRRRPLRIHAEDTLHFPRLRHVPLLAQHLLHVPTSGGGVEGRLVAGTLGSCLG